MNTTTQTLAPAGYNLAVKAVVSAGKASTSYVQRQLKIGYNAAATIIEEMEEAGVISAPNMAGKRKVLIELQAVAEYERKEKLSHRKQQIDAAAEAAMGHNSEASAPLLRGSTDSLTEAAREKLRLTVERIERLEEEKKEIAEQIKEVYGEAKSLGYDTKALRAVVRLRKQDREQRQEQEAILEVYLDALGEL